VDRNGDGKADVVFFDLKRSGKWDISWWDDKYSGQWSLVGYHDDDTLKPPRFESYADYQKEHSQAVNPIKRTQEVPACA
jgi:hypothetical protein